MTHRFRKTAALCLLAVAMLAGGCSSDSRSPDEKFQAYLEQGNTAYKEKHYDDALAAYEKAAKLHGVTAGAGAGWYGVSMVYESMGKHDEAAAALAKAGELSPGLAAPHGTMEASGALGGGDPHAGMGMMGDSMHTGATGGGGPAATPYGDSGWVTRGGGR